MRYVPVLLAEDEGQAHGGEGGIDGRMFADRHDGVIDRLPFLVVFPVTGGAFFCLMKCSKYPFYWILLERRLPRTDEDDCPTEKSRHSAN